MNILIWIIVGGLIGWLASLVVGTDKEQGLLLNVVVGIVGALLAGWILTPLFGADTINQSDFSISALLASFAGAVVLLLVVTIGRQQLAHRH